MKLYTSHYSEIYKGTKMAFAVREGVLRDNHNLIIDDLKFLVRQDIKIILYHNIGINRGNARFIEGNLTSKLPRNGQVEISRIPGDIDFYGEVLSRQQAVDKLIILERQFLIGEDGEKINTISTKQLEHVLDDNDVHGLGIGNINFRQNLLQICQAIESGIIDRVHILPAGKKRAIKNELFSLEGSGTLIGNDFGSPDILCAQPGEEDIILGIIKSNKQNTFIRPRSKEYIRENISHFHIAKIDDIPVGCVEIINIDDHTIELGALAVIKSFLSFKIGLTLVEYVEGYANKNLKNIISLTNNPKLESMYVWRGFSKDTKNTYPQRQKKSPGVDLFILKFGIK